MSPKTRTLSGNFLSVTRAAYSSTPKSLSVRVPEELVETMASFGNSEGLGMSDTIRVLLQRGLLASNFSESTPESPKLKAAPKARKTTKSVK